VLPSRVFKLLVVGQAALVKGFLLRAAVVAVRKLPDLLLELPEQMLLLEREEPPLFLRWVLMLLLVAVAAAVAALRSRVQVHQRQPLVAVLAHFLVVLVPGHNRPLPPKVVCAGLHPKA
jgi:hypothetical protein